MSAIHHDDHDHSMPAPGHVELLEGLERHTLHSVGIDIGSSTSHIAMSRLVIQRRGADLSAEFVVTEREMLFQSPIWLTPYHPDGQLIDVNALRDRLEGAYAEAGIRPDAVDAGAVVITGEALKKENAELIAEMVAMWSGRFICVSAGPNHEAILAAHGSGSVVASQNGDTILNVDIGGGTTKISVVRGGAIEHIESVSVGARLLAFDDTGRISRIEDPARIYLARAGIRADLGDEVSAADRTRLAGLMADVLLRTLAGEVQHELLVATDGHAMPALDAIDRIIFSGGVSEFLADRPPAGFGDLGAELGSAVRERISQAGLASRIAPGAAGIRATVLGASQFTVQATGQTCFISDPSILPVHGLAAIPIDFRTRRNPDAIRAELARHDLDSWHSGLAAVAQIERSAGYPQLREMADALTAVVPAEAPLFVVLKQDLAHSLGAILKHELGRVGPVTVVDGITVGDLDHIDLGAPLGVSGALPVTVTSLQFPHPNHQEPGP